MVIDISGTDTIFSTVTRSLQALAYIEDLILQGTDAANGTGNAGSNGIIGNGAANILAGLGGNDTLLGGGGDDFLFGQAGKDNLRGDQGDDTFVFQSVSNSLPGAAIRDTIIDFDKAGMGDDVIDLTAIPELTAASYIGGASFTGLNQVRIQQVGADVVVQIQTAGNGLPESEILIANVTFGSGVAQINGTDFLL